MEAARIQARAVIKVAAISICVIAHALDSGDLAQLRALAAAALRDVAGLSEAPGPGVDRPADDQQRSPEGNPGGGAIQDCTRAHTARPGGRSRGAASFG